MRFEFIADRSCKIKTFLRGHGISKGLLARIKYQGGHIWVNGIEQNAIYLLASGDKVTVDIPAEVGSPHLLPIQHPLEIVAENANFLLVNKPVGYASIPSILHSETMANFVKAYYREQGYENQQIHIVTRLDRDTSGLMLFAKHSYAHSRMDKALQARSIEKRYYALVSGAEDLPDEGEIIAPIARESDSIITRQVHTSGKYAHTSYRVLHRFGQVKLVDIQLHTGRTHQIRVHFSHIGQPLLGDDLYGGSMDFGIDRQALHCYSLRFTDPFTNQERHYEASLTDDLENVIIGLQKI